MKRAVRLELFRRHFDGELDRADAKTLDELLVTDPGAKAELEAYRRLLGELRDQPAPEPAHDFVAQVMRRLPDAPRAATWKELLFRPRLSLASALGLLVLVALVWLPLRALRVPIQSAPHDLVATGATPPEGVKPAQVLVRFVLPAKGAKRVALAGDFNGWRTDDIVMIDETGAGLFSATVPMPPGRHAYLFFVDGAWVQDPAAGAAAPDGFGHANSVLDL